MVKREVELIELRITQSNPLTGIGRDIELIVQVESGPVCFHGNHILAAPIVRKCLVLELHRKFRLTTNYAPKLGCFLWTFTGYNGIGHTQVSEKASL